MTVIQCTGLDVDLLIYCSNLSYQNHVYKIIFDDYILVFLLMGTANYVTLGAYAFPLQVATFIFFWTFMPNILSSPITHISVRNITRINGS